MIHTSNFYVTIKLWASSLICDTGIKERCLQWPWPLLSPLWKWKRILSFKQLHKNITYSQVWAMLSHYCVSGSLLWPSVKPTGQKLRLMGAQSGMMRHWQGKALTHLVRAVRHYTSPMDHFALLQCLLINLGLGCVGWAGSNDALWTLPGDGAL